MNTTRAEPTITVNEETGDFYLSTGPDEGWILRLTPEGAPPRLCRPTGASGRDHCLAGLPLAHRGDRMNTTRTFHRARFRAEGGRTECPPQDRGYEVSDRVTQKWEAQEEGVA